MILHQDDLHHGFSEWLELRFGRHWCISVRLTPNLRAKGYTIAFSPKRYAELQQRFLGEKLAHSMFGVRLA
jgi:hypothetical protein